MKTFLILASVAALAACATTSGAGDRIDWRCDGGAAFSMRLTNEGNAEVFAGGQVYTLPGVIAGSGTRYTNGTVEYWEHGGEAMLNGAPAGRMRIAGGELMKRLLILASLAMLAACETMGGGEVGNGIVWHCDGGSAFSAHFTTSGAQVSTGGRTYVLPHVQSASGARYSNGSVEYWERGGQATLSGAPGGPYANCRR